MATISSVYVLIVEPKYDDVCADPKLPYLTSEMVWIPLTQYLLVQPMVELHLNITSLVNFYPFMPAAANTVTPVTALKRNALPYSADDRAQGQYQLNLSLIH